ncbi:MAG TPA: alpha/beta fold hydrolase [Blastocatellia bacterium]|jgi:dienelactone hydrolase|nr:alpha/beta fold hydrolase [Blastocatellia bacterium]
MIRSVLFNSILLFACLFSEGAFRQQGSLEGHWEGAVVRGNAVRIVRVDFVKEGDGLKAIFDIPDFLTWALRPQAVTYAPPKVTVRIPLMGDASLEVDDGKGEMTGVLGASTPPVTIHLRRALKPVEARIIKEEVQFQNGDVTLSATLVLPNTKGPHPAIVWIQGRGGRIREDTARVKIFAQHGIASLIYDKRGGGKSTGNFAAATMSDLASDAQAAVEFLSKREGIDPKQIGLHGESAGGWIAPLVAARSRVPVAFVMTSSGPAESVRDQQIHAYPYVLRWSDQKYSDEEIAAAEEYARRRMRVVYDRQGQAEYEASVARLKGMSAGKALLEPPASDAEDIDWLRRNGYDPGPDLKKITVPYLAFYGGRDGIVPPDENVKKLEKYLTEAGNRDFKIVTIPGTGHDLSYPDGPPARSENSPWMWGRVAPGYVDVMLDWLLKRVRVAR